MASAAVTLRNYKPADDADLDALQHNSSMEHRLGRSNEKVQAPCARHSARCCWRVSVSCVDVCTSASPSSCCCLCMRLSPRQSHVAAGHVLTGSANRWANTYLRVVTQERGGYNARALDFDDHVIIVAESTAHDFAAPGGTRIVGVINVGVKPVCLGGGQGKTSIGFLYGLRVHEAVQGAGTNSQKYAPSALM